jgi:hypothetical protein
MSRENNPLTVYLSDDEMATLKQWKNKTGKSLSELGREAITEYTDHDRIERVEHDVAQLDEKLERVLALVEGEHTHTRGQKSVPEKAREIADAVYQKHEMPVNEATLEIEIENHAGGDDRTLEKYKKQLKKREFLFEHPNSAVWTSEKRQWVRWTENAYVNEDVHDITQGYGTSTTEYISIAEELEAKQ